MGILELYSYVTNFKIKLPPEEATVNEADGVLPLELKPPKTITLSQYDAVTKDIITAHRIKDYRRKSFNVMLLPQVESLYTDFLRDVYEISH